MEKGDGIMIIYLMYCLQENKHVFCIEDECEEINYLLSLSTREETINESMKEIEKHVYVYMIQCFLKFRRSQREVNQG